MWILTTIVVSLLIVMIFHQLLNYFKENYSVKKTKDLVGSQISKYKNILNEIQDAEKLKMSSSPESYQMIQYNPDYQDLKQDLECFLEEIETHI